MFMKDQQGLILVSSYIIIYFFNYFCPFYASNVNHYYRKKIGHQMSDLSMKTEISIFQKNVSHILKITNSLYNLLRFCL